jgi:hypothetical protein
MKTAAAKYYFPWNGEGIYFARRFPMEKSFARRAMSGK